MMPIVEYPGVVEEFAGFFSQDLSYHQLRGLKQYLTGLITDSRPSIRRIASRQVEPVDQSSLNRFLTLYPWDRGRLNRRRLELLQAMEETRWRGEGVVALDDTLLPKTGRKMPGAGRLWDHNSKGYVHAQCLVTSHYVDQDRDYPIEYRQYLKHGSWEAERQGFKTKVELAMEMVDQCEELGVPAENYVFDAWYLSRELADHIGAYGKGWVSRLKSNRIVHTPRGRMRIREWGETLPKKAFMEIQVLGKRYWTHTQVLDINKLGKARVVICYNNEGLEGDPVYLVTSRLHWEGVRVVLCYGLRFRIDTFYRDAKQNLGLGGCHLRILQGARSHWLLGFLGYSLLKARVCRSRLYRRVQSDQTIGAECRQAYRDLIQSLIQWVYRMAGKMQVEKILDVILR